MPKPSKTNRFPVKLKMDDEVIVIAGKQKGKRGKIMAIDRERLRVIVQGVNRVRRFQRPSQENPQGGSLEIESPLHLSNVAYYDPKTRSAKRLGYKLSGDKKKLRAVREDGALREIKDKDKES